MGTLCFGSTLSSARMLRTATISSCSSAISRSASASSCDASKVGNSTRAIDLFGDKRHDWMQQAQRAFEDAHYGEQCQLLRLDGIGVEPRLDQFEVPVAE